MKKTSETYLLSKVYDKIDGKELTVGVELTVRYSTNKGWFMITSELPKTGMAPCRSDIFNSQSETPEQMIARCQLIAEAVVKGQELLEKGQELSEKGASCK
jgi:hypothetical protein